MVNKKAEIPFDEFSKIASGNTDILELNPELSAFLKQIDNGIKSTHQRYETEEEILYRYLRFLGYPIEKLSKMSFTEAKRELVRVISEQDK